MAGRTRNSVHKADVLVGVAGWSYEDWKGVAYKAGEKDKLRFLSNYVDCIEVNSTFYSPVKPRTAEKWLESVSGNERFRFTAKLWRQFTHETDVPFSSSEVCLYKEGLKPLKESGRLIAILVQFPFYFRDSEKNRDLLSRIVDSFSDYERVLEVRDRSWAEPEAMQFISSLSCNIACLDMPLAGDSFRETAAGTLGYLRLHGRNRKAWFSREAGRDEKYDYLYSCSELEQQLSRVQRMEERAKRIIVIWNNHFRAKALVNAVQCRARITGNRVKVPPLLINAYPQLEEIAAPEEGYLF